MLYIKGLDIIIVLLMEYPNKFSSSLDDLQKSSITLTSVLFLEICETSGNDYYC